jgi:hypothetical protein
VTRSHSRSATSLEPSPPVLTLGCMNVERSWDPVQHTATNIARMRDRGRKLCRALSCGSTGFGEHALSQSKHLGILQSLPFVWTSLIVLRLRPAFDHLITRPIPSNASIHILEESREFSEQHLCPAFIKPKICKITRGPRACKIS